MVDWVIANYRVLPKDVGLEPIDDVFPVIKPQGCKIEQTANFFNPEKILFDGEIWEALDNYNKAALILHEAMYWSDRLVGNATNSRRSRSIVGHMFLKDFQFPGVLEGVTDTKTICFASKISDVNDETRVYATFHMSDLNGEPAINFLHLGPQTSLVAKRLVIDDWDFTKAGEIYKGEPGNSVATYPTTTGGIEKDGVKIERVEEPVFDSETGKKIPGYFQVAFYLSSESTTYPGLTVPRTPISCGEIGQ